MFTNMFLSITRVSPTARRFVWRFWYNFLGGRYRHEDWTFMNYGYAPLDESDAPADMSLEGDDEADRNCAQMYNQLAREVPLEGKDVIEVGSGRGGGCSYIHRHYKPEATTGFDFSKKAVAGCVIRHQVEGLSYRVGDAEKLPLDDAAVDVVFNVESSHCYGSLTKFYKEVWRTLKPGGYFLYTDFYAPDKVEENEKYLTGELGFELVKSREITPNVVRSLELDHESKQQKIADRVGGVEKGAFQQFAGLKGSQIYDAFNNRDLRYMSYVYRKPE